MMILSVFWQRKIQVWNFKLYFHCSLDSFFCLLFYPFICLNARWLLLNDHWSWNIDRKTIRECNTKISKAAFKWDWLLFFIVFLHFLLFCYSITIFLSCLPPRPAPGNYPLKYLKKYLKKREREKKEAGEKEVWKESVPLSTKEEE